MFAAPTPRQLDEAPTELVESEALTFTGSRYDWGVLRGLL